MAEYYKFFNDSEDDIREYNANDFSEYFVQSQGNGVYRQNGEISLKPSVSGLDMNVTVSIGSAMLKGYLYLIKEKPLVLKVDGAEATKDRIDRVVLRLNLNDNARYIKAFILKGVASDNPIPPTLTRDSLIYEISLAQIRVKAGKNFIAQADLIDERMKRNVCGVVSSQIDNEYMSLRNFNMNVVKFDENSNPIEVEYRTERGLLYKKTKLDNRDSLGHYLNLFEYDYLEDGETIGNTTKWTMKYRDDGLITSKSWGVV